MLADLVRQPEHTLNFQLRVLHKDGRWLWVEGIGNNLLHHPSVGVIVVNYRDISEERERQQRAQQQSQLAAVGQLAAGIAHDFNNIMGAIIIYVQLLTTTLTLNDKDRERLNMIRQQAQYAADLVHQILDFSRSAILDRSVVNLVPFCKEFVKLLERLLPESIEFEFVYDRNEYMVDVDPVRLQQALINLVVNARDALPQGGRLQLHLRALHIAPGERPPLPELTPGDWLSILVTDNGHGISPHLIDRIFEPFFTTKERGKGSGLGLAQVYGIVEQHDGHIGVKSAVGMGSTFTIYLPLLRNEQAQDASPSTVAVHLSPHLTILVVEDNLATQTALADCLEMEGHQILLAANGEEAVAFFAQGEPKIDLVLSDMIMPNMSGTELFQALQAEHPEVKMILMTGYPLEEEGRQQLTQGNISWLQKPFSIEKLLQTIQDVCVG